ncbi:HEPN domain-containing protein [Catalinimonas sp. 4WD22]|uniref:HEPN domain-containing protein n=1 Tax=Catalinimonas locisalis TaxID=3133978 RepID=UPI0031013E0F
MEDVHKKIRKYTAENNLVTMFYFMATNDYLGCRCCFLNALHQSGLVLAEQAIEKILKALYIQIDPLVDFKRKHRFHDIPGLIKAIESKRECDLMRFNEYGQRLSDLYSVNRYPDDRYPFKTNERLKGGWGTGIDELEKIDEFFFHVINQMPMPDYVKYTNGPFAYIYAVPFELYRKWVITNNKPYSNEKLYYDKKFEETGWNNK